MPETHGSAQHLPRTLGLRDLTLLNIVAVLSLRWIATAGAAGPSSLLLWALAALFFFVPLGLVSSDLAGRYPEEGGIYFWTKRAFGERHGFLCGWCYWVNNILYYPNLLLSTAVMASFILGARGVGLADQWNYVLGTTLAMLWLAVALNVVGLETAKWLQNLGAVASYLPGVVLIALAAWAAFRGRPAANEFSWAALVPDLSDLGSLNLWASIAFAFSGIELASTLGGEVRDPRRNLPRSILLSAPAIAFLYIVGTAALLWLLPQGEINVVSGLLQGIVSGAGGWLWLAPLVAACLVVGNLGTVGAWLAGPARVAFTIGLDRYFPPAFARIHPRFQTPYVAILVQGTLATVFLLLSVLGKGSTVEKAYLILLDTMLLVYFIPYVYLFSSHLRLRPRADLVADPPMRRTAWSVLVPVSGLCLTLFAMAVAMVPPTGTVAPWLFEAKVVGGALAFVVAGGVVYWRGRRRHAPTVPAAATD
jgi:glutamate:GABA antiporter